jgi:glucan-binding YG repeat protein
MVAIKRQIDNDDHYDSNSIKYIVMHGTGNRTDSDEANANYFTSGSRGASAHYFVDDDSITQVVEDFNGAYHCGDGKGEYGINNHNSLGIEMCEVEYQITDITLSNSIDLVKMKMSEHGVSFDNVVRHYDASRKSCPEALMANNWAKWYEFKERLRRAITGEWVQGWNQNATGWWYCTNIDNKYYYKDSWELIKGEWYSFDGEGYARKNTWIKDNNIWYYLDQDCKMISNGWKWIDNECYCFDSKGHLYLNTTTPDNYRVDNSGAWIN